MHTVLASLVFIALALRYFAIRYSSPEAAQRRIARRLAKERTAERREAFYHDFVTDPVGCIKQHREIALEKRGIYNSEKMNQWWNENKERILASGRGKENPTIYEIGHIKEFDEQMARSRKSIMEARATLAKNKETPKQSQPQA